MRPVDAAAKAIAVITAGIFGMIVQATAQEAAREPTGGPPQETPTAPIAKNGDTASLAAPTETTSSGMILVSKRPIAVLAGPSSSASILYGFPPGRPFRLIGRNAGFAQIQDLKSGATGWIDETTLAVAPSVPAASVSSELQPGSVSSESKPGPRRAPRYLRLST